MRIAIHISNLRLERVEAMTGEELAALVEAELQRLVEVWGVPPALRQGGALQLDSQAIEVAPGASREQVGTAVARHLATSWFGTV
ncbi:MAG TPA: hypothetical protein VIH93_00085 [Thermoanaerobaculia bacterium]|jgi:hypothetical protein